MPASERLWRTDKGDLVPDGHPEAVTLAYAEGDDLDAEDEGNVRKQASKPANKQAPKAADKQAAAPKNK